MRLLDMDKTFDFKKDSQIKEVQIKEIQTKEPEIKKPRIRVGGVREEMLIRLVDVLESLLRKRNSEYDF